MGYRVHQAAAGSGIPGFKALDLWVDAGTGSPDHVGIAIQEPGKPLYQMRIRDIRVGATVNRSVFDMTPPAGYTAIATPNTVENTLPPGTGKNPLDPVIKWADALTAVVVPVKGPYGDTPAAVEAVELQLKKIGITPAGPPFGRNLSAVNGSNQTWEVGYPILVGRAVMGDIRLEAPFEVRAMPAELAASKVVPGPGEGGGCPLGSLLKVDRGAGLRARRTADGNLVRPGRPAADAVHRNADRSDQGKLTAESGPRHQRRIVRG